MSQSDLVGHTLGQYTVMERLGRGGMADVYKAFHPQLEVYRAIKVIRPEFVTTSDFRMRFQKEAQAVAALRHPNIVQIHDFGEQDDAYYMVMEFVRGRDLKRIIQAEGRIRPIRRAVEIVEQIAGALHYAHAQGLIHRDIKPENIMITDDGLPILMDFGIAKLLTSSTQLTQTGLSIGTPAYMAPEQAKALPEIGPAADIYSLSVVLYEMLTGRVPYSADTPMAVVLKAINDPMPLPRDFSSDISESLQAVLLRGLAKEASNRYPTAKQFQDALHQAIDGEAPPPETAAATEIIPPRAGPAEAGRGDRVPAGSPRRFPWYALAGGAAAVLVAVILYLVLATGGEQTTGTSEPIPVLPAGESAPAASEDSGERGSAKLVEQKTRTESGQPMKFTVEGGEGDVLYLQVFKTSETTDFVLTTPDGRSEVFKDSRSHGPVTLKTGGNYTLSVLTRYDKAADIDFILWRLDPAVIDGGNLEPGKYTQGKTSYPGQTESYGFDAQAGETLFFDLDKASQTTDFILTAPDGRTQVFKSTGDQGPLTVDRAGSYTLLADPRYDQTSEFEFTLWSLETPVVDGGTLELGKYTQGRTTVPGQTVSYGFEAKAGGVLFFDLSKASETTDFILTAPDGRTQVFKSPNDQGPVTVDQAGRYTLVADPRYDKTSEFEFTLWSVDTPVVDGGTLELGEYTQGKTTVPGQVVSYSFDAQAGGTLFFDLDKASETTDFILTAPDGRTQVFKSPNDQGPFTLDQAGRYTLVADPRYDKTSEFEFTMWSLDTPVVDGGKVELGEYAHGKTTMPGQIVSYTFDGEAGQVLQFEITKASQTTNFTLTAPDGRTEVFNRPASFGPFKLEQSGTYTLVADPYYDKTSEFEFRIRTGG